MPIDSNCAHCLPAEEIDISCNCEGCPKRTDDTALSKAIKNKYTNSQPNLLK
jgi:hypothetical protein